MQNVIGVLFCVVVGCVVSQVFADSHPVGDITEGLIAQYAFDQVSNDKVKDVTGKGHDASVVGKAHMAGASDGRTLRLDGKESYLVVPPTIGRSIKNAITIAISCKPAQARGGLFGFTTGPGWSDQRFVLAVNTYGGGSTLNSIVANGADNQILMPSETVETNRWSHFVMSVDERMVRVYRDGIMIAGAARSGKMDFHGIPLWFGRCQGLGDEFFSGLLGDARVYDRALESDEVLALYKQHAKTYQRDTKLFDQPDAYAKTFEEPGWIVARADCGYMRPLPTNARIVMSLHRKGVDAAEAEQRGELSAEDASIELKFDTPSLPAGEYELRASVLDAEGTAVGNIARSNVRWKGRDHYPCCRRTDSAGVGTATSSC